MYASHHAALGTPMAVAGYTVGGPIGLGIGLVTAFVSHHFLDRVGEHGYGPLVSKQTLLWEGVPFLVFVIAAWMSGIWWVFALGWVASLLMDLIDKPLTWIGKSSIFPCHTTLGFVKLPLTLKQTQVWAVISAVSYLVLALII